MLPGRHLNIKEIEKQVSIAIKHYDEGRIIDSEQVCSKIMLTTAHHPKILNLLGIICFQTGRQDVGLSYLQQAVSLQPEFVGAQFNLAKALQFSGQLESAVAVYRKILELNPDHLAALNEIAQIFIQHGLLSNAMACLHHILQISLDNPGGVLNNIGLVQLLQGESIKAEVSFRKSLEYLKYNAIIHSNLLSCLQYNQSINDSQLFAEHIAWEERHGQPRRIRMVPWSNIPSPDRIIRIGYVSPDFVRHPVGNFISSVLHCYNKHLVEIFCYSDCLIEDDVTVDLRSNAVVWKAVHGMPDEQLADIIRIDQIDILVDLAGHTRNNRLPVFAMKPAPIQVTWAGYVGTTGLSAMDYLLSDERQSPDGAEVNCVEAIVRLPDCYVCYTPPEYAPDIGSLPSSENGFVTFGCFNNLAKVTTQVVELWSRLLKSIPNSRLLLRTKSLGDSEVRCRYLKLFASNGIATTRISLEAGLPHRDLLDAYNKIDISLDPFPYSGGLTTLESLWMGVPVITLGGSRFCSRHSISHLTTLGLANLVASNADDYLSIAKRLVQDKEGLSALRLTLRSCMAGSPICDAPRFTSNLETAYINMWKKWCDGQTV